MGTSTTATPPGARPAALGPTFRAARLGAGLSVRSLANAAGISHTSLSRWERGERDISESTYQHLTLTLGEYVAGKWAA